MPAQTQISVNDGKSTPVAHVFQPMGVNSGIASYAETSSDGSLTKRNLLQFTQKLPGKGRSTVLEQFDLVVPYVVTESVNGVARDLVHSNVRFEVRMISDPAVPESVVNDVFAMGKNMLAVADVKSAIVSRVGFN